MQEEIEKIGLDKDEQMMLIEKLKQAELDREVEFRIAMKKSDHLVFQILLFFNGKTLNCCNARFKF